MLEKLRKYVNSHEKIITINTLENEIATLKEMIVEDQYEIRKLKAVIKKLKSTSDNSKDKRK